MVARAQHGVRPDDDVVAEKDAPTHRRVQRDAGVEVHPVPDRDGPVSTSAESAEPPTPEIVADRDGGAAGDVQSDPERRARAERVQPASEPHRAQFHAQPSGCVAQRELHVLDDLAKDDAPAHHQVRPAYP